VKRLLAATFALVLPFAAAAEEQELASQIIGVWKLTDVTAIEVATGKRIEKAYGEKPIGYFIYTKGGHFLWTITADGRDAPAGSAPTNAERVYLFNTLSFGSGTYMVEGKTVLHRYESSWHQVWTGNTRSTTAEIVGSKLTMQHAPFNSPISGAEVAGTTTFERAE
jgi:hypothetical protein